VRVLAIIPARRGSTRLRDKPLRLLAGEPLIVRVLERVASLRVAESVVVATDDAAIVDAVKAAGGRAVMTRNDHVSGTDRVAEAADLPEFSSYDVILNVQGDEPFVDEAAVRGAVAIVTNGAAPIGTAAAPADAAILTAPDCVKVVCDDNGRALYFSRAPIPFLRDAADEHVRDPLVRLHIGVYAYTRDALRRWVRLAEHPLERIERLEQLRPLAHGIVIGVASASPVTVGGIDTEVDLLRANAHWESTHALRSHA
jgi:3-deoxy-manno-octulosonate cytidylyltransferase (CMP-KDO synthetase)